MSALQFLRERAGILVAGVIGISLLLFVASDFFGKGRGQRIRQKNYYEIGNIDGEYISYQDYDARLKNLTEIYKLSGRTNIDESTNESMREQIWQKLVREKILFSKYEKLGIGVSTEELDELVLGNDPHQIVKQLFADQETGSVNKSFLVNFLKQTEVDETAKTYWLFFEDEIVNDRMNSKYNNLVAKGLYVTSKQAEFDKNLADNNVDFSFILKNYASVPDSMINVSKNDIDNYYSKHKSDFKRTAQRDIEYVTFDIVPSDDDIKQTEEWINKIKEEFSAAEDPVQFINLTSDTRYIGLFQTLNKVPEKLKDFAKKGDKSDVFGPYEENDSYKIARLIDVENRPDSVHVRHILLSVSQSRSLENAESEADSLITLIKSGTPFEKIAMDNSDDQSSAQVGGDLGWFEEGTMVVPFNNACFTGKKGDIRTVQTTFGIHIIEIIAQSKKSRKYNIGYIERNIIPSSQTNQKIYSEASRFAGTNDTYDKFILAIESEGIDKRVANNITPQQKTLPGLDNPRLLIMSLFEAEKGKIILDNNQQAVFEIGDKYVVAYCTRIQTEGIAPVEEVEDEIHITIVKDKKADYISSEFMKANADGKNIEDIAEDMNLTVNDASGINFKSFSVPGAGNDPALVAAASAAKQGVLAGPVKGNNGVYMMVVSSVTKTDRENIESFQKRLTTNYELRGSYEAYEALRKSANVVDKRYKFY